MERKLAFVLGIRPDLIRAAILLKKLSQCPEIDFHFIWSGQHYNDNLKDVFFRDLDIPSPVIDLGCSGNTDAEIVGSIIKNLYQYLNKIRPQAVIFLGDTNTTTGALASAQLNIPIVHVEGCMRSYDWRMPEEKYRTVIDHLSDVIYTYYEEYKEQGIREGLNPNNIIVVGNPIVDVLQKYYFDKKEKFEHMASLSFFSERKIIKNNYYLLTCHRRENVENRLSLDSIWGLLRASKYPIYFPASYRTQRKIKEFNLSLPSNVIMVNPVGYEEMLCLVANSRGVLTDSGTIVEETCVLQVPSVQMRRSTERPQVYDAGSSIKFDPTLNESVERIYEKLEGIRGRTWSHNLGDGKSSERIFQDIRYRLLEDLFHQHLPKNYHIPIGRSYQPDGVII